MNEEWRSDAKCRCAPTCDCNGAHTEMFYPPRDRALYTPIADKAKAICRGKDGRPECPVRVDCLLYAINREEEHGIFGGMSHRERNALVRKYERTKLTDQNVAVMSLRDFLTKGGPS